MWRLFPSVPAVEEIAKRAAEIFVFKGLRLLLIIFLSYLAYELGSILIKKSVSFQLKRKKEPTIEKIKAQKRALTLGALFKNLLKYLIFFVAGFEILTKIFGIDAAPLVASAGIVGLAIGFGAQSLVKDIVSGFFILFENQFAVGDFVAIKATGTEAAGIVEEFGLRSTTVRNLSGNLHYIPNGNINGIDKYPKGYIPFSLELLVPAKFGDSRFSQMLEKWGNEISTAQPLFVSAPKLAEIVELEKDRALVHVNLTVVPTGEWLVERCGQTLARKLKEALKLKEEVTFTYYPLDRKVLAKHKKTIIVK